MLTTKRLVLLLVLAIAGTAANAHAATLLVENGQPRAEIVTGDKPARMAKFAAREVQTYLEKISGAKLPIVTAPSAGATRIYIGTSAAPAPLGRSTDGLANGAFRIGSGSDWLALLGPDEDFVPIEPWGRSRSNAETARVNAEWDKITGDTYWNNFRELYTRYHADLDVWDYDDTGTLNAAYEFLRGLGVRWYAPGELGEVVPQQKTIALPQLNKTVQPDFPLRRLSYYGEHVGLGEIGLWNLRLGVHQGHKLIGKTQPGHGIKFVIMREEMKRAHPELYIVRKGKPDTTHKGTGAPCLSSPLLLQKQLEYARAVFDHFKEPMLSIDMVDGYGGEWCEHQECRRQATVERGWPGSMSDYVWGYLNRVALELHKSHPDRMVSGLAYSAYLLPPEKIETMSPNLAIIECRWRSTFYDTEYRDRMRAVREAWRKKLPSGKYAIWDYYLHSRPEQAGRPVFFPRLIAEDLRELKGFSMGDSIEVYRHPAGQEAKFGYDPLAVDHLNLYVTSRLWWDSAQDLGALLEDYYTGYYGPARAQMKALIEFAEAEWMHMSRDPAKIGRALELLATARAAAAPETVYGRRIEKIAAFMKPLAGLQEQLSRKRESAVEYRVLLSKQAGGKPLSQKPLDGQVHPEFWPPVRVAPLVKLPAGGRPKLATQFQALRDGDVLHFAFRCQEPDIAGLNIGATQDDDPKVRAGDHVTLLIETPSRSYYEIAVSPSGAILDVDHGPEGGIGWSSGAQAAVHRGDGFWSVEIRVPIVGEGARVLDAQKGIDGAPPTQLFPWYFNVGRQRVRGGQVERMALSPTGADTFAVPEKFAKLWGK